MCSDFCFRYHYFIRTFIFFNHFCYLGSAAGVETFGAEYVQTYGLTETSPYLTFSLLKRHQRRLPADEQMRYRSLTGRAVLGVRLRVVDEDGRDVAADGRAVGEIVARSDRITPGYWRLPEATAEAFSKRLCRKGIRQAGSG